MTVWLDTDTASRAADAWTDHAEHVHRSAFELEHRLAELGLAGHTTVVHDLTAAATALWTAAALTRRAVGAALRDDTFVPVGELSWLTALAGATGRSGGRGSSPSFSAPWGDPGGTGRRELRTPYSPAGATPIERSRDLVARALADTSDARRLRADEFGLVQVDTAKYVVVLPGVVDLSRPDLGWSEPHRSVRDLDQAAFSSSRSVGTAGNPYASMVQSQLLAAGVPMGSELLIVGHSFGADTALDLAADRGFNGGGSYRVTHVVAAGYHSAPQLSSVASGTQVLVLQNHRDMAVIVEAVGDAHVVDAITASAAAGAALASFDVPGAIRAHARSVGHRLGALWSGARHVGNRADDLAKLVVGAASRDPLRVRDGTVGFVTLEPGVDTPAAGQVVTVFEGGGAGAGHDPQHYVDHVRGVEHPDVVEFLASLDDAGYTGPGVAVAVDVSVPAGPS